MSVLPSSMGAQMGMAQSQHAAQNVQDQSRTIDTLKRDLSPPKDKAKKLREACEGFESVFIQKMWEQMRATVPKGGLLQGRDEQYWQGMFDQELSKKMSSAGGIGLADMMYEQLSRNLVSATRTTASGLGAAASDSTQTAATGFVASAAPLLPPAGQSQQATAQAGTAGPLGAGNAKAGMYAQEAPQPQAATPDADQAVTPPANLTAGGQGNSQSTDSAGHTAVAQGQAGAASQAAPDTTPAEVQQVLDQLRTQATTTMTGAQAIAAVQSMTPSQALALSQGMSWSQVQAMQPSTANLAAAAGLSPEMLGQAATAAQGHSMPSGLENARAATQAANTRMPAGGVLPPMTPMQREARMNYSAAKVQGQGMSSQTRSPLTPATTADTGAVTNTNAQGTAADILARTTAARQSSTMPTNPNLSSNVQGSPGVSPTKFVQNSPLINNGAAQNVPVQTQGQTQAMAQSMAAPAANVNPAPIGMTGEQIAALSGQAPQGMAPHMPQGMPQAGTAATLATNGQQLSPTIPATAQEPQIVTTTYTTNVPPSRRNSRQGQRVPKGQPAIRTLNTGGQG